MSDKKRWSELSEGQQTAIVAAGAVQVSLCVAALVDLHRRPAGEINGRKAVWTAAAFVNFIGPIAYFAFGRKR
jgi:hypothetical protein